MVVYIVSGLIIALIIVNFILGKVLYEEPKEKGYFANVTEVDRSRDRVIAADPKHVLIVSVITGLLLGIYMAYVSASNINGGLITFAALLILVVYLIEITRTVTFKDGMVTLSKFLSFTKEIKASDIVGMYIYSYNKKFLKKHAYTTKLIITERDGNKTKFTLSSLDNKAILNMMKENFGINSYKMYITKHGE